MNQIEYLDKVLTMTETACFENRQQKLRRIAKEAHMELMAHQARDTYRPEDLAGSPACWKWARNADEQ